MGSQYFDMHKAGDTIGNFGCCLIIAKEDSSMQFSSFYFCGM